jgi:hypothetical protein
MSETGHRGRAQHRGTLAFFSRIIFWRLWSCAPDRVLKPSRAQAYGVYLLLAGDVVLGYHYH